MIKRRSWYMAAILAIVFLVPLVTASASPGAEAGKTLRWAFFTDGNCKDDALVYAEFNKRLAKYMPGMTIDFVNIPYTQYKEKYTLIMAAKETLDLVWAGYLFDIDEEIAKGAYMPLNDLLTKNAPKLYAAKTAANWARITTDGKIYGLPHGEPGPWTINDIRVIASVGEKYWTTYKADMAKIATKIGMQPEDYDLLAAFLERAKQGGSIMKGWDVALARWAFVDQVMDYVKTPYGILRTTNDMKVVNEYETADYKTMCDQMSKWFKNGYIIKDIMSIENKRAWEEKLDGNIMFTHGWQYVETTEAQDKYSAGLGMKVWYAPLHNEWLIANARANVVMSIPTQSKNPVQAIKFLELLTTQDTGELATLMAFGIEGKHWTKVADGVPGKTPMTIKTLEYDSSQGTTAASYATYPWAVVDNLMRANNQAFDPTAAAVTRAQIAKSKISPLMGFQPKTKEFATEFAQVQAVVKEFEFQLEFGTLEDNSKVYADFMAKLKAAGNDKIKAALQTQLDAFLKAKK
jgi:putative aldouronate transport system substrate-binding protein